MSTLFKSIISNSNNEYFGNSSLGFPITGAVAKGLTYTGGILPGWQLAQKVTPGGFDPNYYRYNPSTNTSTFIAPGSNVVTGTSASDYIAGYNWKSQELDILWGGAGADTFVLGDAYGVHYQGQAIAVIADFSTQSGDRIQLSTQGAGYYSIKTTNLLGTASPDLVVYYKNDPIALVVDNVNPAFSWDGFNRVGTNNRDILTGASGNDTLLGFGQNDQLVGNGGSDLLAGGQGKDTLVGGLGVDGFVFAKKREGTDRILDFSVGSDFLLVSAKGFGGKLKSNSFITKKQFQLGKAARDRSDRFIYNQQTGALLFDSDGIGRARSTQIAQLSTGLALTSQSIYVFG